MPVVFPGKPVGSPLQPRLEDVGRVRAAPRHVPLAAEPGQEQLRLVAGEHRPALVVGAKVAIGGSASQAGNNLAITYWFVAGLVSANGLRVCDCHRACDRTAELAEHGIQVGRVADAPALGKSLALTPL